MPVSRDFLDFVLEQLAAVSELRAQRLFGGMGLYSRELIFGLLHDDVLFLKVDDTTRPAFVAAGMGPFRPMPEQPEYVMHGYYEVPADVLEDRDALAAWARLAMGIAAAPSSRPRTRKPRATKPPTGKAKTATPQRKVSQPRRGAARPAKPKRRPAGGARRRAGGGGSKRSRGR